MAADLSDNVSTKNELKLYEKDQIQPFHESISEEKPPIIAVTRQGIK